MPLLVGKDRTGKGLGLGLGKTPKVTSRQGAAGAPGWYAVCHSCPQGLTNHPGFQTGRDVWHLDQDVKGEKPGLGLRDPLETLSHGVEAASFMRGHTLYVVCVFSVIFFI